MNNNNDDYSKFPKKPPIPPSDMIPPIPKRDIPLPENNEHHYTQQEETQQEYSNNNYQNEQEPYHYQQQNEYYNNQQQDDNQFYSNNEYNQNNYHQKHNAPTNKKTKKNVIIGIIVGGIFIFLLLAVFSIFISYKVYQEMLIFEESIVEETERDNVYNDETSNNDENNSDEEYIDVPGMTGEEANAHIAKSKDFTVIEDIPSPLSIVIIGYTYLDEIDRIYKEEVEAIVDILETENIDDLSILIDEFNQMHQENQLVMDSFAGQSHEGLLNDESNDVKWSDLSYFADELAYFHHEIIFLLDDYYNYVYDVENGYVEYNEEEMNYHLDMIDEIFIKIYEYDDMYIDLYIELSDMYTIKES